MFFQINPTVTIERYRKHWRSSGYSKCGLIALDGRQSLSQTLQLQNSAGDGDGDDGGGKSGGDGDGGKSDDVSGGNNGA